MPSAGLLKIPLFVFKKQGVCGHNGRAISYPAANGQSFSGRKLLGCVPGVNDGKGEAMKSDTKVLCEQFFKHFPELNDLGFFVVTMKKGERY